MIKREKLVAKTVALLASIAILSTAPALVQGGGWHVELTDNDGNTRNYRSGLSLRKASELCKNYEKAGRGDCKPAKDEETESTKDDDKGDEKVDSKVKAENCPEGVIC